MVWIDPTLKPIEVPVPLLSRETNDIWYQVGAAKFQLLPKQYQFLSSHEEFVSFLGGYGCKSKTALINGIPIPEWRGGIVDTTLGKAASSRSYLKGKTDLYIVRTLSGQETEVTLDHRFLTLGGWRHLRVLRVGDVLAVDGSADGPRRKGSDGDWADRYGRLSRPCGGRPLPWQVAARGIEQRLLVPQLDYGEYGDARCKSDRPSRTGYEYAFGSRDYDGGRPIPLSGPESPLHQLCTSRQSLDNTALLDKGLLSPPEGAESSCAPYNLPSFIWTVITDIRFKGYEEFWDISVPGYEHYVSDGFVDHNSGKTRIGSIKATYLSMSPGNRGLVGMEASTDLDKSAQRDLMDFLWEAQLIKKEPTSKNNTVTVHCVDSITGKNLGYDSEIEFVHLDDPKHVRGRHLGWFWIDEGSKVNKEAWQNLIGRLRLPAFKKKYQAYVTGNPEGHNWIYDFFFNEEVLKALRCKGRVESHRSMGVCKYSPEECNLQMRRMRRAYHCTSTENYFLPPDYLDNMAVGMSDEDWERYVNASFDVFSGAIFKEWSEGIHVLAA